MSLEILCQRAPFTPSFLAELGPLCAHVFGTPAQDLAWRLQSMPDASVFYARASGQMVGFKAGYAMSQTKYYSWLGGTHPQWRRTGIASALMQAQHLWLIAQGYQRVETATNQDNLAMCQTNLRHGMAVCGMRTEPHRVQVLFAKGLADPHKD